MSSAWAGIVRKHSQYYVLYIWWVRQENIKIFLQCRALPQTSVCGKLSASDTQGLQASPEDFFPPFLINNMAKQMTLLLSIHLGLQESIVKIGVITLPHMHSTQTDQSTDLCAEWVCKAGKNDLEKGFKWCEGWSKPGFQRSLSAKDTAEKENSHYLMSHLKSALSI